MTVPATYDGRAFVPTEPVSLPVGTPVTVEVADPPEVATDPTLALLREWAELPVNEDWPPDGVATFKPHHRRKKAGPS